MSYELAKAYVQIIPTTKGITGELESALGGSGTTAGKTAGSNFASGFGKAIGTVGKVAGAALVGAGAALTSFTKSAVSTGMEFDSAMSQVAATMGTTVDQIGNLRDFAQEMGASTVFSATQAAEALNYMALAGYDADTSMSMLPNVLSLAAAGGIDLASASDMVTDAASAMGMTLEDGSVDIEKVTTMVDQMAKTASKSNTSVEQLGEGFLKIGATARNLSGGTQELSTMLGVLADNGIKGAEGGTHLRNILLSLQQAAEDGTVDFGDFSVAVYDSDGNMRSMVDIVKDMQDGLGDMSQEAKDAITSGVFNKTDLASINALLGTSTDRFDELYEAIGDCSGAAQEMADTQLDNLSGDITLMQSAFEGLQIAISDGATPSIREAVQGITDIINGMNDLVSGVDGGSKKVKQGFEKIVQGISDGLPTILKTFSSILEGVGEMFPQLLATISQELPGLFNSVISTAKSLIPGLMDMLPSLIDVVTNMAQSLAGNLSGIIMPIVKALPGVLTHAIESIDSVLPSIMKSLGNLAGQIIGKLPEIVFSIIKELPSIIWTALQSVGSLIEGIFTGLFDSMRVDISPEVQVNLDQATTALSEARDHIKELMSGEGMQVDLSFDVSPTGKSYSDLESIISTSKQNIISILQQLNEDSAEKRQEDLNNLAWYKSQLQGAYEDKETILRTKMRATLGILQEDNSLTTEQYAEMIGQVNAYADEYKETINAKYDAMVDEAFNEMQLGNMTTAEYNNTVTQLMLQRQRDLDSVTTYASQTEGMMADHVSNELGIWNQEVMDLAYAYGQMKGEDQAYMYEHQEVGADIEAHEQTHVDQMASLMSDMVNNLDSSQKQALATAWDTAFEAADIGDQIPTDIGTSIDTLLSLLEMSSYDTNDAGKELILSLIEGTDFYKNDLASEWESLTQDQVIEKVRDKLGIAGGSSSVMEELAGYAGDGFVDGIGDKAGEIAAAAGMTADEFLDSMKSGLDAHSPSRATQQIGQDAGQGFINGIEGMQGSINSSGYSVGNMLASGLSNGINAGLYWVVSAARSVVSQAIASAKALAGISSPSKVMRNEVGLMLTEGMGLGITDGEGYVLDAIDTVNDDMMSSWNDVAAYGMDINGTVQANSAFWDPDQAGSSSTGGENIVINVYGAEGQNVSDLAEIIAEKIQMKMERKAATYA